MSNKNTLIHRLALGAHTSFGIKVSKSKRIASKFVNEGHIDINDPMVNHGDVDPYVRQMLQQYHVMSKKQLRKVMIKSLIA